MEQGILARVLGGELERQRTSCPQGGERRLVNAASTALIDLPVSAFAPSRVRHPSTHSRSHNQLTAPQTPHPEPRLRGQSAHILYARHCYMPELGREPAPEGTQRDPGRPCTPTPHPLLVSQRSEDTEGVQLASTPLPALFPYPHPLKNLQ